MNLSDAIQLLEKYVQQIPARYRQIPVEVALQKPAPGKWSKQEILGHLIDSAINNLKRFTDSQFLPQPYSVLRYQQDDVVIVNRYQQLPADHLLQLWAALNQQIVYVMKNVPADKLMYEIITPSNESKTLQWLMIDYVQHMEHHLKQVFG